MCRRMCVMAALVTSVLAISCSTLPSVVSPAPGVTIINFPATGSQYYDGEEISVQSTSSDPSGIARAELLVDGTLVRSDTPAQPQPSFIVEQMWSATDGSHTITVRAFNQSNQPTSPASIIINVLPVAPTPMSMPTAAPTLPATAPSPASASPGVGAACTDDATLVANLTVPDGTLLATNQTFNKEWRLRNTGTCTWGPGYSFALMSGNPMGSTSPIGVPGTPPGATADLLVPMAAPLTPGVATGFWQLRNPAGRAFGVTLSVDVDALALAFAPTPVPPPTATMAAGCHGGPKIASFSASPSTITAGQSTTLSWGFSNAQSATIDKVIGIATTPGAMMVSPHTTTIYTLRATCGANVATAQAVVTVASDVAPATPTHTASPTGTETPTRTPTPGRKATSTPTRTR